MNFYNDTVIDKQTYMRFQIFHGSIFKRVFFLNIVYYFVCFLVIVYAFYKGITLNSLPVILVGVTLVIIWLGLIYSRYVKPRGNFEKNVGKPLAIRYHFYPNSMKILKDGAEENNSGILYKKIFKVYEKKDVFYIYYTRRIAYIVSKSGFASEADINAFSGALSAALGKKYIKAV